MTARKNLFYMLLLAMALQACTGRAGARYFEDRAAAMAYMNDADNGLMKQGRSANGIDYVLRYQPTAMLPGGRPDSLEGRFYFVLSLSHKDRELLAQLPREVYATMVNLFSFGMDRYVHFKVGEKDAEDALMVFYQPTYGLSNANSLLVAGDRHWLERADRLTVLVDDFGLGTGRQQFEFEAEALKRADSFRIKSKK